MLPKGKKHFFENSKKYCSKALIFKACFIQLEFQAIRCYLQKAVNLNCKMDPILKIHFIYAKMQLFCKKLVSSKRYGDFGGNINMEYKI